MLVTNTALLQTPLNCCIVWQSLGKTDEESAGVDGPAAECKSESSQLERKQHLVGLWIVVLETLFSSIAFGMPALARRA